MNILNEIFESKKAQVAAQKNLVSVKELEQSPLFAAPVVSFKASIKNGSGVIAEIKRQSPSQGAMNLKIDIGETAKGYTQAGASAISVLTDKSYFGGGGEDLIEARKHTQLPLLRKDFMLDEYQILEAKAMGADAILLIAAMLDKEDIRRLAQFAHSLQLEVLLEIHQREQLDAMNEYIDVIGVNNRDLAIFKTDIMTSFSLLPYLPESLVKISESGIESPKTAALLKGAGFDGFLIGGSFMKQPSPATACTSFIRQLNQQLQPIIPAV